MLGGMCLRRFVLLISGGGPVLYVEANGVQWWLSFTKRKFMGKSL